MQGNFSKCLVDWCVSLTEETRYAARQPRFAGTVVASNASFIHRIRIRYSLVIWTAPTPASRYINAAGIVLFVVE